MNTFYRIITTSLIVVASFVAFRAEAVRLSPVRAEFEVSPGESVTGSVKVHNNESRPLTLYTSAQTFQAQGETGSPELVESKTGFPAWISMEPAVYVPVGETVTLDYSITVPSDATPGGNFGAIVLSPETGGSGNVVIGSKIAMLVFLRVAGDINEEGGIIEFKPERRVFSALPVSLMYRFNNNGGDRLLPQGHIKVRSLVGIRTGKFDANPVIGNVLPQSVRSFTVEWARGASEQQRTTQSVEYKEYLESGFFGKAGYQLRNFGFGFYFATVAVDYGFSSELSDRSTTWFIVFPWQLIICLVVILGALYAIGRYGMRAYSARIIKRYASKHTHQ
jgi:hypothetical protein